MRLQPVPGPRQQAPRPPRGSLRPRCPPSAGLHSCPGLCSRRLAYVLLGFDVHPEYLEGCFFGFLRIADDLYTTSLTASPGEDLRLDGYRVAKLLGCFTCLLRPSSDDAFKCFHAEPAQQFLPLILVEIQNPTLLVTLPMMVE